MKNMKTMRTFELGNIYLMKYYENDDEVGYYRCIKITKRLHYFEIVSSMVPWILVGTRIKYSIKELKDIYRYILEYSKESHPEEFL